MPRPSTLAQIERQHRRLGIHVEPTGLRWGTPRTRVNDPRFTKRGVPADAFGPNAAAVWAVLDRLSWCTYDDAQTLQRAARGFYAATGTEDRWAHYNDAYHSSVAAKAAGGWRFVDWCTIRTIVQNTCNLIRPRRCAIGPNSLGPAAFTADSALWCDVVQAYATSAGWALLVADQVDVGPFTRSAYAWMTGPWLAAFGDPGTGTPPAHPQPTTCLRATGSRPQRSR